MEKSIFLQAIEAVESGAKFVIKLDTKSCRINKHWIIKNGEYSGNLGVELDDETTFLEKVEKLFELYSHSIPSERTENRRKNYFKAIEEKDLSDDDMLYGERREIAQFELEFYVLAQSILGFQWNQDTMGRWFWQSPTNKRLIILKQWINK